MKKLKTILAIVFGFAIINLNACTPKSDDENNNRTTDPAVVGKDTNSVELRKSIPQSDPNINSTPAVTKGGPDMDADSIAKKRELKEGRNE
ncbi:hypothetical protein FEM33_00720 [Dyadobacter flavalbus]|uniref:Lipoprotein n=1 Tax=Dyadobacter flavalbus TaxID=2579942 RepID=A0A5M8R4U5_9BACT|nr:hypothetical protein [Dyadobacter flavalbus]KAA6441823.1 hypothetical protein FEM33_00720 [Dyadobacter flavalbus]